MRIQNNNTQSHNPSFESIKFVNVPKKWQRKLLENPDFANAVKEDTWTLTAYNRDKNIFNLYGLLPPNDDDVGSLMLNVKNYKGQKGANSSHNPSFNVDKTGYYGEYSRFSPKPHYFDLMEKLYEDLLYHPKNWIDSRIHLAKVMGERLDKCAAEEKAAKLWKKQNIQKRKEDERIVKEKLSEINK